MRLDPRTSYPLLLGALLAPAGCHPDAAGESTDGSALAQAFPAHAAEVLEGASAFAVTDHGFTTGGLLSVELPRDGAAAIRFQLGPDAEVRVREIGAAGAGTRARRAVAYRRAGGASFWTAGPSGVEEWLHLEAGAIHRGEVVAAWDLDGATATSTGGAVKVRAPGGRSMWVTAPAAFAASGRAVAARLQARGDRIELFVDADAEEVLVDPAWAAVAPMGTPRFGHAATLLPGGAQVLVAGGLPLNGSPLITTEIYDIAADTWTPAAAMPDVFTGRFLPAATLLGNGLVLVTGGEGAGGDQQTGILYDSSTNHWSSAGTMSEARYGNTATLLLDGEVLVAGGSSSPNTDRYDPVANAFTAAAPLNTARSNHTATRLPSGKVLVAGGTSGQVIATAEIYDPVADTWTYAASMNSARDWGAAALLGNGTVLVVGGFDASGNVVGAEVYDPTADQWTPTGPMITPRGNNTATLLANGTVLTAGGTGAGSATLASAEIYDPTANTWTADVSMMAERYLHAATLLPSGEVLVTGGYGASGAIAASEAYGGGVLSDACTVSSDCAGTCDPVGGTFAPGVCTAGSCASGTASPCAPYTCGAAGCLTSCTGDAQCASTAYCNGTACVPVQSAGVACTTASQCQSGFCADGFCCDQACTGPCDACSTAAKISGANGTCGPRQLTCPPVDACQETGSCNPADGSCVNVSSPDGSLCTSEGSTGVCIAGTCLVSDSDAGTSVSSSSTGAGTGGASMTSSTSSSGTGTGGAAVTSTTTSASSSASTGGAPSASGNGGGAATPPITLEGNGCSTGRSGDRAPWLLLSLLLLARRRGPRRAR